MTGLAFCNFFMKKILFRADAKPSIGVGDLMSLVYLSKAFQGNGWDIHFMIKNYEAAKRIIRSHDIENYEIIADLTAKAEIVQINNYCTKNEIKYVFTCITERKLTEYKELAEDLIKGCINFDGIIPEGWNLVVNWDVKASKLYKIDEYPGTEFLLGPKYVILPHNFDWDRIRKRIYKQKPKNILIVMGGADEFNLTEKIVRVLNDMSCDMKLNIVLGPGYKFKKSLLEVVKRAKFKYDLSENIKNMFDMYLSSDLAIGSGGLVASELVATGTPTLLIGMYEHQIARCRFFERSGFAVYLGHKEEAITPHVIQTGIDSLFSIFKQGHGDKMICFKQKAILDFFNKIGTDRYVYSGN